MLAKLLHIANSSPIDKEAFYPVKTRILKRFAHRDGIDLQELPGNICWSCDGGGLFYHYSGDSDMCWKCDGSGWYKQPSFVTLQRWRLGRFVFHQPIDRHYGIGPYNIRPKQIIEGYVAHKRYSFHAVRWATLTIGLVFDRDLAQIAWREIYRRWWIVQLCRKRCMDCKRHLWRRRGFRCTACDRRVATDIDEIPF